MNTDKQNDVPHTGCSAFVSFSGQLPLYFIADVNSQHFTKYLGAFSKR